MAHGPVLDTSSFILSQNRLFTISPGKTGANEAHPIILNRRAPYPSNKQKKRWGLGRGASCFAAPLDLPITSQRRPEPPTPPTRTLLSMCPLTRFYLLKGFKWVHSGQRYQSHSWNPFNVEALTLGRGGKTPPPQKKHTHKLYGTLKSNHIAALIPFCRRAMQKTARIAHCTKKPQKKPLGSTFCSVN